MPTIEDYADGATTPSVGGSYYLCIDPSCFGSIDEVKARSDSYIDATKSAKPRPGHSVRIPGETGYNSLTRDEPTVQVLENHWVPFFETIAGKYGLSEKSLRVEFENARQ